MAETVLVLQQRLVDLTEQLKAAESLYNKRIAEYLVASGYWRQCSDNKAKWGIFYSCRKKIQPPGMTETEIHANSQAKGQNMRYASGQVKEIAEKIDQTNIEIGLAVDITHELAELEMTLVTNDNIAAGMQEEASRKRFQTYVIPSLIALGLILGFWLILKKGKK